jgi:hypothetical protein
VFVAGVAGAVVDSWIFLHVAFGSLQFMPGQVLGKAYGVTVAAVIVAVLRQKRAKRVTA